MRAQRRKMAQFLVQAEANQLESIESKHESEIGDEVWVLWALVA